MSVRRGASQLLSARSIHLRIVPRPTNLSESREIFRVLQQFGDLSVFKYLKYEYHSPADNIALAIFRDSASAQKALDASPIRFALEKVLTHPDDHDTYNRQQETEEDGEEDSPLDNYDPSPPPKHGIDEILRPSSLVTRTTPTTPPASNPPTAPPMPFDPSPTQPTRTKWFQVTIDRSRAVHQDFVERQPYWKSFSPMKSIAQMDLAKQVPHPGLSDVSKRPLHQHRTPLKVLKQMSEYVERVMPSLRGMAENSNAERGFRERRGLGRG
ncbi:hypothetical protein CC86DRAFT_471190 [Ophiobolus disseminans]|uniref:Uncharacterized protein n=1 Tax=Ophiobolus disseminans TaxID=1469910 RepID=A0A6A6ZJV8_9PLEO|nr:hypothetical protein CC86DRAFT_471190 [Ophiobolus disseminans]